MKKFQVLCVLDLDVEVGGKVLNSTIEKVIKKRIKELFNNNRNKHIIDIKIADISMRVKAG